MVKQKVNRVIVFGGEQGGQCLADDNEVRIVNLFWCINDKKNYEVSVCRRAQIKLKYTDWNI